MPRNSRGLTSIKQEIAWYLDEYTAKIPECGGGCEVCLPMKYWPLWWFIEGIDYENRN